MPLNLPFYIPSRGEEIQNRLNKNIASAMQAQQLQNAILKSKYLEDSTKANIYNKQANTNKLLFQQQNPFYGLPGIAGQLGAAELVRKDPSLIHDENAINLINRGIGSSLESKEAQTDLRRKQTEGYEFNTLPKDTKSYLLAQVQGMGVTPEKAVKMLRDGKTIDEIAVEQGFDPNNLPDPTYPLTTTGQTQLKSRQASLAELNKMGKTVSSWAGPYSQKILGISPKLFSEAITGKNPEEQAKFYAAQMLAPELSSIRIKAMGGNVGIEAIREMTEKSMLQGKSFQSLVTPEVYQRANELVEDAIYDAVQAANNAALKAVGNKKSLISEASDITPENKKESYETKGDNRSNKKSNNDPLGIR